MKLLCLLYAIGDQFHTRNVKCPNPLQGSHLSQNSRMLNVNRKYLISDKQFTQNKNKTLKHEMETNCRKTSISKLF